MSKSILVLVSLVLILGLVATCNPNQMPTEKPKNFGFVLKYGVGARNVLSTNDRTFTKDLISAGTKTTELKLSDDELSAVYRDMKRIRIMDYPEVFEPGRFTFTQRSVSPPNV